MINSKDCAIDHTLNVLERTIENRKIQMRNNQVSPSFSPVVSYLYSEILNKTGGQYAQLTNVLKKSLQSIQEKPWESVCKTAMYSFAIGLFLSLRHGRKG